MANTRGLKTAHPCPVCLVPKEALSEYCDEWEYRDPEATLRLAMQANDESLSQDERMEAVMELEEQGFRPHAVSIKGYYRCFECIAQAARTERLFDSRQFQCAQSPFFRPAA